MVLRTVDSVITSRWQCIIVVNKNCFYLELKKTFFKQKEVSRHLCVRETIRKVNAK